MASNTGCTSDGELAITFRISAVAVCRSSASFVSLNSRVFSIAITAWSAKVWSSCDVMSGERARLCPRHIDHPDWRSRRGVAARSTLAARASGFAHSATALGPTSDLTSGTNLAERAIAHPPRDVDSGPGERRLQRRVGRRVGRREGRQVNHTVDKADTPPSSSAPISRLALARWRRTPAARRPANWRSPSGCRPSRSAAPALPGSR